MKTRSISPLPALPMSRACKIFALLALLCAPALLRAQELKIQPTPFTVWLDFRAPQNLAAARSAFPIWLESVEVNAQKSPQGIAEKTTFRLRFRRLAGLNDELLVRLYFDDKQKPVLTAWNEIGTRVFEPKELGQGLGLPASETVILAMPNVDYVDIEVPGDGSDLRGALLSSVQKTETRKALDFNLAAPFADPFENTPPASPNEDDSLLFGRVKATLGKDPLPLNAANDHAAIFEFDLSAPPLLAVLSFEISNADITAPPEITANETALGAASIVLPDLADPAFEGSAQPAKTDVTFRYAGWLKCQKILPGSALRGGANRVQFTLPEHGSEPVAIRAVEVQLKYSTNANSP